MGLAPLGAFTRGCDYSAKVISKPAASAHGIANQATTVMISASAASTMIAHSVTQIANGTRFRCMFVKRGEVFHTIQKTSRAMRRVGLPVRSPRDVVPTNAIVQWVAQCTGPWLSR